MPRPYSITDHVIDHPITFKTSAALWVEAVEMAEHYEMSLSQVCRMGLRQAVDLLKKEKENGAATKGSGEAERGDHPRPRN